MQSAHCGVQRAHSESNEGDSDRHRRNAGCAWPRPAHWQRRAAAAAPIQRQSALFRPALRVSVPRRSALGDVLYDSSCFATCMAAAVQTAADARPEKKQRTARCGGDGRWQRTSAMRRRAKCETVRWGTREVACCSNENQARSVSRPLLLLPRPLLQSAPAGHTRHRATARPRAEQPQWSSAPSPPSVPLRLPFSSLLRLRSAGRRLNQTAAQRSAGQDSSSSSRPTCPTGGRNEGRSGHIALAPSVAGAHLSPHAPFVCFVGPCHLPQLPTATDSQDTRTGKGGDGRCSEGPAEAAPLLVRCTCVETFPSRGTCGAHERGCAAGLTVLWERGRGWSDHQLQQSATTEVQ
jgi:hypothetical protein